MITITYVLALGALAVSVGAYSLAKDAYRMAEEAQREHEYTLHAADALFEDHEERIGDLEDTDALREFQP